MLMIIGAGLLIFLGHEVELHLGDLENWLYKLGIWAPLGYIGVFVLLTPLWISVDALCFISGLLFPLLVGELYMMIATYLAAALIFVLGRYLFRDKVNMWMMRQPKLARFNSILSQPVSLKLMFLLRLIPLPFALLSYALAIAPVRFWSYLAATSGIFVYNSTLVYLGYATKHITGLIAGQTTVTHVPVKFMAVGLALTLIVLTLVARIANQKINQLTKNTPSPPE